MADYILRKLKEQGSEKKENVVIAAAKIIKEEIREMEFSYIKLISIYLPGYFIQHYIPV